MDVCIVLGRYACDYKLSGLQWLRERLSIFDWMGNKEVPHAGIVNGIIIGIRWYCGCIKALLAPVLPRIEYSPSGDGTLEARDRSLLPTAYIVVYGV